MGLLNGIADRLGWRSEGKSPGPADDFWYQPIGARTGAGIRVTPEIAVKASAVFACVSLLAEVMATVPFHVYRKLPEGGREAAPEHPLEDLVASQPNDTDTAFDFWGSMIWHAVLRGTGYAEIIPGPRGAVHQLVPLHPDTVTPEAYGDKRRPSWRYRVRAPGGAGERVLLSAQVFRIPGLVTGGVRGMGLVDHGDEAIALSIAADQYAARVFSNSLNMGFILTHPGKMSEEAKTNFLKIFMRRAAGIANAHRPILLQDGIKAEKMAMTAKEAQMEEGRKFQILEIARRLRIPPHMVGIADNDPRSNVEEQSLNFVRYTLLPLGTRIEQAARRDLLTARDTYTLKYNFEGLLRGNSQARADYFSKALGAGGSPAWLAVDEVREVEGYNRLGGLYAKPAIGTNPSNAPADQDSTARDTTPARKSVPPPDDDKDEEARSLPPSPASIAAPSASTEDVPQDTAEAAGDTASEPAAPQPADPAGDLVAKEIAALRKAAMRFAGDDGAWRAYARNFFAGQVSDVMRRLGASKDLARLYCQARTDQCLAREPFVVLAFLEESGRAEALRILMLAHKEAA